MPSNSNQSTTNLVVYNLFLRILCTGFLANSQWNEITKLITSGSERYSIGLYISNSSSKFCQCTRYCIWPHTRWLLMIFSTTKNSSSCLSSSISICLSGHSRIGFRRGMWMTLFRLIRSRVSTSYTCELTFRLTIKGLMYFEVSIWFFPDLIVRFRQSTSTLSLGLYDCALSKLNSLRLSLICLRVLWMLLWTKVILFNHSSTTRLADMSVETWIVLRSNP